MSVLLGCTGQMVLEAMRRLNAMDVRHTDCSAQIPQTNVQQSLALKHRPDFRGFSQERKKNQKAINEKNMASMLGLDV